MLLNFSVKKFLIFLEILKSSKVNIAFARCRSPTVEFETISDFIALLQVSKVLMIAMLVKIALQLQGLYIVKFLYACR